MQNVQFISRQKINMQLIDSYKLHIFCESNHILTKNVINVLITDSAHVKAETEETDVLSLSKFVYCIHANRTPLLIRTPVDTFWRHYGHF